ncbi:MAG: hypothetical protein E6507_01870 [Prevotella bivia]|jgi:hypothetical protein|uniref:Uncharacterized protein n=3 Tax=Prevotella bivia TaxID=28125 RepID=I4ZBJ1_9BACT|nr:hypothetical protein [Prevotella bivia]EFB93572.1 hypothetical protein HMPREF0648_1891 [Prevotella bivia JCVIHMP010]EIM33583.1 hypothetical protein PrebiDRAFT_1905 [Prevotella bivia DSM 20514]KGF22638.1 hypothetical protein HMPREF1651_04190 [Prevotella bivia DNF00188]KGF38522.1 hypothetical protein HMPREF2136_02270 [Prevotella bivia DNF00650]KGF44535.1 hypothetical protein HMPREF0647_06200 [Prevotella bivia DNF00320]
MTLQDYRQQIIAILLKRKNAKGETFMTELEAKELLAELSDEELEEGMMFNEPEDVAELLIEIGKL